MNENEGSLQEKFPSLAETLNEARRQFDIEEGRRKSIESKTSMVIGIDAIIISLVGIFSSIDPLQQAILIAPAILSTVFGLVALRLKKYEQPLEEMSEFYKYAKMEENEALDKFLTSYIDTTETNLDLNDRKVKHFRRSFWLTGLSIVLLTLLVILQL